MLVWGSHDRMLVRFTTTCAINAYQWDVPDTTLCNKVCQ